MSKNYEPDKRFLERLEWQLSSEYRRASRLKSSSGKIAVPRMVAVTAVMLGMLMTGVTVIKATEFFKDRWRKKIEIARVETEVELKKAHLESTREIASSVKKRVSDGLIRDEEYLAMKRAVDRADLDLKKSLLNLDEVKASGTIPRNELYAPEVGGLDFVSERLKIEKKEIDVDLEQLRSHLGRFKQMIKKGLVGEQELSAVQSNMEEEKVKIAKVQKRLELRKRFLAGEITALEVEVQSRLSTAEKNLHLAQSKVDSLMKQMNRLKTLEARGLISPMEITQTKYHLDAAQAELKLASLEIDVLKKVK